MMGMDYIDRSYLVKKKTKQETDKVRMTPVVWFNVVRETAVKIFIIQNGEGDLTRGASGDDEGHQGVAHSGEPPDEGEHQGCDDEKLHVDCHIPGDVHAVGLARAVNVLGVIVDVEKVQPPALLTFFHTGINKM